MGTWSTTVTNKGIALQAKQVRGATITFTKVVAGSGSVPVVNLKEQTAVSNIKQTISVESIRVQEAKYTINVLLSNAKLTSGYNLSQIGFYATDPNEGEILFAIAQIDTPKAIPTNTDSPGYCLEFAFTFQNSNEATIEITPDMAAYMTRAGVDDVVNTAREEVTLSGASEGNPITIEDSTDAPFSDMTVYGASEQETTNGYQLFKHDATELATFSKGGATVTNNGKGSFTVTGSGKLTEAISKYHYYTHAESVKMFKAGKLKLRHTGTVTTPNIYIHPQTNSTSLTTLTPGKLTEFELTQDMLDNETFRVVIGIYANSGETIVPGTFGIMLYQDGDGIYEKFTGGKPAPNPDYPQEIESVGDGGSVNLKTTGKNLYNCRDIVEGGSLYNSGVIDDDDFVTIEYDNTEGTTTAYKNFWTYPCQHLKKDTDYRIVVEVKELLNCGFYPVSRKTPDFTESQFTENLIIQQVGTFSEVIHTNNADWTGTVYALRSFVQFSAGMSGKCVFRISLQQVDDTNTEYEPHKESTATVPLTEPLYGIPVSRGGNFVDANGQHWICDEIDLSRGVHIQRIGKVTIDSTYKWHNENHSTYTPYWTALHIAKRYTPKNGRVLCTKYIDTEEAYYALSDMHCSMYNPHILSENAGKNWFYIRDDRYTDVSEVNAYFSENTMDIYFELAEHIETPLTDKQLIALQSLQTFESVTNVFADEMATMEVEYFKNNGNGRALGKVKQENNNLWKLLGDVNTLLAEIIG